MLKKIKHFAWHSSVLRGKSFKLLPRIASGYFKTLVMRRNVLRTLELSLLAECNSQCVMCYAANTKREDENYLSVAQYRTLWQQAKRLGALTVTLSGGEPTLRGDLFDIIAVFDPHSTVMALVTNALNTDKACLKDLKKAGVNTVHFSLESSNPQTNDTLRGMPGHFNKVMTAIDEAKQLGLVVCLSTVIMHNGLDRMRDMAALSKRLKTGIVFSPVCLLGRQAEHEESLLTHKEWELMLDCIHDNTHIRTDWMINYSLRHECPGGREKIAVSCYGDVIGCAMNPVSFGNIKEEPLETIWRRMHQFPDFKKRSRDCLISADREYIENYIKPIAGQTVPVSLARHPLRSMELSKLDAENRKR